MTETTTEMAVRTPVQFGGPLAGLDEAYRLSQNLAVANVMPRDLRGKPSDVLAIILYGQDLGLSPMQAIQGIYVVEGRPTLSAQMWIALARRAGHKVTVVSREANKSCTIEIVRGDTGERHTETATIEQAVKAGKVHIKDGRIFARSEGGKVLPWEAYTDRLLLARAASNCCRFICPEIAYGFYSEADIDDLREGIEDSEVVPVVHAQAERDTADDAVDAEVVEDIDPEVVRDELASIADGLDFSSQEEA